MTCYYSTLVTQMHGEETQMPAVERINMLECLSKVMKPVCDDYSVTICKCNAFAQQQMATHDLSGKHLDTFQFEHQNYSQILTESRYYIKVTG